MRRFLGIVTLALLTTALANMPWKTADAQSFDDATSVVVVEVPVNVLKDGQAVRGLTRENFQVFDGKKEQEILDFEVIDLQTAAAGAEGVDQPPIPITARRHFLFLFDLVYTEPQSVIRAQEAALDLVRQGFHESDLGAVALATQGGPQLLLGFTTDRFQIEAAISTLGLPQYVDVVSDPLSLTFGDLQDSGFQPSGGDPEFAAALGDILRRQASLNQRQQQAKMISYTQGMGALAELMGGIQGRKHVVLLSEGFDAALIYGSQDSVQRESMNLARETNQIYEVDSDQYFGDTRSRGDLDQMLEQFRRSNATIQAVDIGGLDHQDDVQIGSSDGASANRASMRGQEESLSTMAASTGGQIFKNTNNLAGAMEDVLETTGVTYLLAFQPKSLKLDGKYHKLRVKLKDAPRGTKIVHRPGYFAPKPFSDLGAQERKLMTAEQILGGAETEAFGLRAVSAAFAGRGGEAYVPILVEIDGKTLAATTNDNALMLEIYVYAIARNGRVHDFVAYSTGYDLGRGRAELEAGGLKFFGDLELPPGDYSLRVFVRNSKSGVYSLKNLYVDVPAIAEAEAVLSPALFADSPEHGWLPMRENVKEGEEKMPYPFFVGGASFVPTAMPVVGPLEEAAFRLVAYNLGSDVELSGRIIDTDGEEVDEAFLEILEAQTGEGGAQWLVASFDVGPYENGDYRLELTAEDADGKTATSHSQIRIEDGGP